MPVRHVAFIFMAALIFVSFTHFPSAAHRHILDDGTVIDWYPPQCCDNKDCRPVQYEYVYGPNGARTHVRMLVEGEWEQYPISELQRSRDHLAHWCGTVRPFSPGRFIMMECIFVPKGSASAPVGNRVASVGSIALAE